MIINKEYSPTHTLSMKPSIVELLDIFMDSGRECVEIVRFTHKDAQCCAKSIKYALKRYRINTVRCECKKGHVYLIKISV